MYIFLHFILSFLTVESSGNNSDSTNNTAAYYLYYKSQVISADDFYERTEFLVKLSDKFLMDSFKLIISESLTDIEEFNSRLLNSNKIFIDFQSMASFKYYNPELEVDTSLVSRVSNPNNYLLSLKSNGVNYINSDDLKGHIIDIAILKLDLNVVSFTPVDANIGFRKVIDSNSGYLTIDENQQESIGLIAVIRN